MFRQKKYKKITAGRSGYGCVFCSLSLIFLFAALPWKAYCSPTKPENRSIINGDQFLGALKKSRKNNVSNDSEIAMSNIFIKDKKDISGETFPKRIKLDQIKIKPGHVLIFNECSFQKSLIITGSFPHVAFNQCVFKKDVILADTDYGLASQNKKIGNHFMKFTDCRFEGTLWIRRHFNTFVYFHNSTFLGNVSFGGHNQNKSYIKDEQDSDHKKKSIITHEITFNQSIFKRKADFPYTEFSQADFTDTVFEGPVDFTKAKFQGAADFTRVVFRSSVDFDGAIFYPNNIQNKTEQAAIFYNAVFKKKASFNKTLFLTEADFKQTTFEDFAFFINTCFSKGVNFKLAIFERQFMGSHINVDDHIEGGLSFFPRQYGQCRQNESKGEVLCIDNTARKILREPENKTLLEQMKNNRNIQFVFSGAQFRGRVDLRNAKLGEADFSTGKIITVFRQTVDFTEARIKKINLKGTVFMSKVNLSMEHLFKKSGWLSKSFTLHHILLRPKNNILIQKDDCLKPQKPYHLGTLYTNLETLFRKYGQIAEANEMAVRYAFIRMAPGKDFLRSFLTFVALPIWNLIYFTGCLFIVFYVIVLRGGGIKARARKWSFTPAKLPLVFISEEELGNQKEIMVTDANGIKRNISVEYATSFWQKALWPLFLCIGTFFAIFSMGSEYVTNDEQYLKRMKVLRAFGFALLPLFIYSIAKRSEGLHTVATFF